MKGHAVVFDDSTLHLVSERVAAEAQSVPAVMKVIAQEQPGSLDTFERGTAEAHARRVRIRRLIKAAAGGGLP